MSWQPLIPAWLMLLAVVAGISVPLLVYRGRWQLLLLRWTAVGVVLLMLANPQRVLEDEDRQAATLAVVVDASASMGVADADDAGSTRLAIAKRAAQRIAESVDGAFQVEHYVLAAQLAPGQTEQSAGDTRFDDLADLARAGSPAPVAVVLLSDGVDRGDAPPEEALAAAGIPVTTIAIGSTRARSNCAIDLAAPSPTAFRGQDLTLVARLRADPASHGRRAAVVWEQIAADGSAEILGEERVVIAADTRLERTVRVGEVTGDQVWRVRLESFPDEATAADNHAAVAIQVVDEALRVLVLEGQPYWDTSFAVRALRRDQQLEVATAYRIGPRNYHAGVATPEEFAASDLEDLDILVLGRRVEEMLDEDIQDHIAEWVRAGGGAILLGPGQREVGPLATLDPVRWSSGRSPDVRAELTASGRRLALLPAVGKEIPSFTAGRVHDLRVRSDVLVGGSEPMVIARRHGAGRVVVVNAEGLWRWRLQTQDDHADRFWRQLAKSVVADAGSALRSDRPGYRPGDEARISVAEELAIEQLTVEQGDHRRQVPVQDGFALVPLSEPGLVRVTAGELAPGVTLIVREDVREIVDVARDDARLLRLAQATGGEAVAVDQAAAIGTSLARRAELRARNRRSEPLITEIWWLLLLTAGLAGEWWIRRRRYGVV